jgi:hypothetical protein
MKIKEFVLFSFIFVGEIVGEILFYVGDYQNQFIQLQDKEEWQIPCKNKGDLAKEILFLSHRS